MVLFDEKNCLQKYKNTGEIIDNFCKVRYAYYVKRKKYQIDSIMRQLQHLGNKERFILEVINETIDIMNVSEKVIIQDLKEKGYDEDPSEGTYDYLLRLQVRTFTAEKVASIRKTIISLEKDLEKLKKTSESKIWIKELKEFTTKYQKWEKSMEKRKVKKKKR
jgi:DNA gyrase/topoisomerase IV subunit A